ncbi:unnamed protein product [Musa acuminata var. zebrina]
MASACRHFTSLQQMGQKHENNGRSAFDDVHKNDLHQRVFWKLEEKGETNGTRVV